jgi:hypothetical protein
MQRFRVPLLFSAALASVLAVSCADRTPQEQSAEEARERASSRRAFVQQNDIEFKNYDRRQVLADDPNAIIWCTSSFPIASSPLFTIPVVGKLTSGSKRPYPKDGRPGPDGMYGSSGEYRYGFTPTGVYADWYGMPVFCTTEPMVWQRKHTTVIMDTDQELLAAQKEAQAALGRGDSAGASKILSAAIGNLAPSQAPEVAPDESDESP